MRTNDLFLTAAAASMMMLAACTHDDGGSVVTTPTPASNEIVISTSAKKMGITRSPEADATSQTTTIQGTLFDEGETIDIFLEDATLKNNAYHAANAPLQFTTAVSGAKNTLSYNTPLYWPKLLHPLYIFGVYPSGSVTDNVSILKSVSYAPFDVTNLANLTEFYFTVQQDQTTIGNYKSSDLMTGLPSGYSHSSDVIPGDSYTAPFKLEQNEYPGEIPLLFNHRLSKIIVNVAPSLGTNDIKLNKDYPNDATKDHILYGGTDDTQYAVVTLLNTARKTWFKLYESSGLDVIPASRALYADGSSNNPVESNDYVTVGKGKNTTTFNETIAGPTENVGNNYIALSLAAIVPPQIVPSGKSFIKVDLYGPNPNNASEIIKKETFLYQLTSNLTLEASKVYTFNIRINKPNIVVNATITDWVNGTGSPYNEVGVLQ